jgi:Fur family zinc uptake transcriptional regulator
MSTKPQTRPATTVDRKRLEKSLQRADEIFTEKKMRFTDLRRQVFNEIAQSVNSIGAYEILARLADKGTRLAPISVYRSLDALLEAGVIHRLESRNSYFACRRLHTDHDASQGRPIFLACEKCGVVAEVDSGGIFLTIERLAREAEFRPRVKFVEVSGLCRKCAAGDT